jgi:CheY-like chemotaxis protein
MQTARRLVLLVEDDPDIGSAEKDCLELEGYSVIAARNGREALSLLDVATPDLIVLDLMMPELDGFGFLREFRRRPEPRPRVLAMSAFADYLPKAVEAGATATMSKPFRVEEFLSRVDALSLGRAVAEPAPRAPVDERERLRTVTELQLDRGPPTEALDEFVQRVARIFDVPICLVSIVTVDRQHWHAGCGLPETLAQARGTARVDSFCTHAVDAQAALVVQDSAENPFFAENPLVRDHGIRFYAGVPLVTRFGHAIGTLCLMAFAPHPFTAFDLDLLSVLARRVIAELEWRERRARAQAPDSAFRGLAWVDEELGVLGREAFTEALKVESLRAARRGTPLVLVVAVAPQERLGDATAGLNREFPRALLGRLGLARIGVIVPDAGAAALPERVRAAGGAGVDAVAIDVPRVIGGAAAFLREAERRFGQAGLANLRSSSRTSRGA